MKEKSNILNEELKAIAPHLAELPKGNHFFIPDHYFAAFSSSILEHVKQETESPDLDALKSQNPFEVPYNYFESLPNKILERVRKEDAKTGLIGTIVRKLEVLLQPKYGFAAVALLIGVTFFIIKINSSRTNTIPGWADAEQQVTAKDLSDYVSNNIDLFDEKTLAQYVSNEQLDNAPFPMKTIDTLNLNNQDIIDLNQVDENAIREITM